MESLDFTNEPRHTSMRRIQPTFPDNYQQQEVLISNYLENSFQPEEHHEIKKHFRYDCLIESEAG